MAEYAYPICVETDTAVWVFAVPGGLTYVESIDFVQGRLREILQPESLAPSRRAEVEREIETARVTGAPRAVRVVKSGDFRPSDLGWF